MRQRWAIALVLALPASAQAYSDPTLFADPALDGGSEGRFFTGSRIEGYSCNVCHQGGPAPRIVIDDLPTPLVAGTRYSLVIRINDPEIPQALQLELLTPDGTDPDVTIPSETSLPDESRCGGTSTGLPAIYDLDLGRRRVVGVKACGASRVDVSFVATGEPIEVSIGGVRSNEDGTANGDGVFDKRFTLSLDARASGSGCSSSGDVASMAVPFAALALCSRRRRRLQKLETE